MVPRMRDGVPLVMSPASFRATLAGSLRYPPTAQPSVSATVRFTWCITSGGKSSYDRLQAYELSSSVVRSISLSFLSLAVANLALTLKL